MFGEQNKIRKLCVKIHQSKWFDNFILATILVNSLVLALTDYSNVDREGRPSVEGSWRNAVVEATESVFTSIFTVEFLIKAIGMGMILDKGSYLRDGWNWLDFIVVVSG